MMHKQENPMDTELLAKLKSFQHLDVSTRNRILKEGRLYGAYDEELQSVHIKNAKALYELVCSHGWPGISKVGLEGSRAAWLVAQHAIGLPELQKEFLRLLKEAADMGEAPLKQVAFLSDRIRFNEGKPQIYGTVLDWDEDGELNCELEDPEKVDERRAAVGLPPFGESLREHRKEVEVEGGKPPANLEAYRQAGEKWARSVGWR